MEKSYNERRAARIAERDKLRKSIEDRLWLVKEDLKDIPRKDYKENALLAVIELYEHSILEREYRDSLKESLKFSKNTVGTLREKNSKLENYTQELEGKIAEASVQAGLFISKVKEKLGIGNKEL